MVCNEYNKSGSEKIIGRINALAREIAANRDDEIITLNCCEQIMSLYARMYEKTLRTGSEAYYELGKNKGFDPMVFFTKLKACLDKYDETVSDNFHAYFMKFFIMENQARRNEGYFDELYGGIKYKKAEAEKLLTAVRALAVNMGIGISNISDNDIRLITETYNTQTGENRTVIEIRNVLCEADRRKIDRLDMYSPEDDQEYKLEIPDLSAEDDFSSGREMAVDMLDAYKFVLEQAVSEKQREVFRQLITTNILKEIKEHNLVPDLLMPEWGQINELLDHDFIRYINENGKKLEQKTVADYQKTSEVNISRNYVSKLKRILLKYKKRIGQG
ncbi:hypothetical protein [Thermincola ferriacetica]